MKKREDSEKSKKERLKRQFTTKLKYQVHPTKKVPPLQLWKWACESHWTKVPSEIIKEIGKRMWRWVKGKRTEEKTGEPSSCVSQSQTATQSSTLSSLRFLLSTHSESGTPASPQRQLLVPLSLVPLSPPQPPATIAQECGPLHRSDLHPQR